MSKGTIIYIGGFEFPEMNAAAHRAVENGKIFKVLGYETVMIGVNKSVQVVTRLDNTIAGEDTFETWARPYPKNSLEWIKHLWEIRTFRKVLGHHDDVRYVVCYNLQSGVFWRLINLCGRKGIEVIADCTEWYGNSEGNLLFNAIKNLDTYVRMNYLNRKADKLIVVSRHLSSKYHNENKLILPMLFSAEVSTTNPISSAANSANRKMELIYAGIPFRLNRPLIDRSLAKDRLDVVLLLLDSMKDKCIPFKLHIYGITKEQYLTVLPDDKALIDRLDDWVDFHGYVANKELKRRIGNADFSILLRDTNRVTLSGFPTKFSESIRCGTPVIATATGDMEIYLEEGETGFFVDISDITLATRKMEQILNTGNEKIQMMKECCRNYKKLDTYEWVDKVAAFLFYRN